MSSHQQSQASNAVAQPTRPFAGSKRSRPCDNPGRDLRHTTIRRRCTIRNDPLTPSDSASLAGNIHPRPEGEEPEAPPTKKLRLLNRLCHATKELATATREMGSEVRKALKNPCKFSEQLNKYVADHIHVPSDRETLKKHEEKVLKDDKLKFNFQDVVVEKKHDGKMHHIHSVCCEPTVDKKPTKFPLILIHGYPGGLACFHKNFSSLCEKRRVYAIDLPGFALSSRVEFKGNNLKKCRNQMVDLIEMWRSEMAKKDASLDKFILLGHSFGGYVAGSYALKYKEHVRHLILADPWGVLSKQEEDKETSLKSIFKRIAIPCLAKLNKHFGNIFSLKGIRGLGEVGFSMIESFVPSVYGPEMIPYIYHANKEEPATGEEVFVKISKSYIWPKISLKNPLIALSASVPVSFLFGERSSYKKVGTVMKRQRNKNISVKKWLNSGHHLQAEDPVTFNKKVNMICSMVERNKDCH